ncbi:iron-sulfur cluster assembly accessory protein [Jeotgalibacillus aurantiacus]|uniref:adhesin n=1 Tax=Jeotgalibacillus aurantiacus TaxID=2763266 RepID=UPI001D0B1E51|nr:adhesin [Jeotgalibacillus aurantiacus]
MVITDTAKQALLELFDRYDNDNVRIYFAGQGDGTPDLGLGIDPPEENDIVWEINSIKVAIDPQILFVAENITLDVQDTPDGRGVVITSNTH